VADRVSECPNRRIRARHASARAPATAAGRLGRTDCQRVPCAAVRGSRTGSAAYAAADTTVPKRAAARTAVRPRRGGALTLRRVAAIRTGRQSWRSGATVAQVPPTPTNGLIRGTRHALGGCLRESLSAASDHGLGDAPSRRRALLGQVTLHHLPLSFSPLRGAFTVPWMCPTKIYSWIFVWPFSKAPAGPSPWLVARWLKRLRGTL